MRPPSSSSRWDNDPSRADDGVDDRATTPQTFASLTTRFGHFTLDVAASADNTKCPTFYTRADDGLTQPWSGHQVWCNPPFSDITPWIRKAWDEHRSGDTNGIVMLLPANRTEQAWWQDLVEPFRDGRSGEDFRVEFQRGRMRFLRPGDPKVALDGRPPFGVVLLIWGLSHRLVADSGQLSLGWEAS